jgi:hypothetical protein
MATKRKAPGAYAERKNGFWHREQTRRWVARKKNAQAIREEDRIDLCQQLGGARNVSYRLSLLRKLRTETARKEKELLATTSLGDLIK